MELWLQALLFGLFSAASLSIGAVLGIALAPVSEKVTARWMAFGSGALVFAVATQLYGEVLLKLFIAYDDGRRKGEGCNKVCEDRFRNVVVQNMTGIAGAVLYV